MLTVSPPFESSMLEIASMLNSPILTGLLVLTFIALGINAMISQDTYKLVFVAVFTPGWFILKGMLTFLIESELSSKVPDLPPAPPPVPSPTVSAETLQTLGMAVGGLILLALIGGAFYFWRQRVLARKEASRKEEALKIKASAQLSLLKDELLLAQTATTLDDSHISKLKTLRKDLASMWSSRVAVSQLETLTHDIDNYLRENGVAKKLFKD